MNESERQLLENAREALGPSPAQREALRTRIDAALAAPPAPAPMGLALPLTVAGVVLVAAGLWVAGSRSVPAAPSPDAEPTPASPAPPAEPSVERVAAPSAEVPRVEPASSSPRRAAAAGGRAHPSSDPRPPPTEAAAPEADSLAREIALVGEARRAIARGDGAAATAALARHEDAFPDGAMSEERRALVVLAWCASGEQERAEAAARAFLARHPTSVSAARVRASCAGPAL